MKKILMAAVVAVVAASVAVPAVAQPELVPPSRLVHYWVLTNTTVDAMVPNTGMNLDKPGCASVSYTIGSDGVPRDIRVRKVIPAGDLGVVAQSVIQGFRYAPSSRNPNEVPVRTYYIVPFNLPTDKSARERITHACDLPGYDRGG